MTKLRRWKLPGVIALLCTAMAIASQAQTLVTVATFDGRNGFDPGLATPTQGADGNLYGTTLFGGRFHGTCGQDGCGLIFRFSPSSSSLSTLYKFCSLNTPSNHCLDGYLPFSSSSLFLGADADLYGTTFSGGTNAGGTLFKMTLKGKLATMYSFCSQREGKRCLDGFGPWASVTQGFDGYLYGATYVGGVERGGTLFRSTPTGGLTTLHMFSSTHGGSAPESAPVVAYDGNLYGTTTAAAFGEQTGVIYRLGSQGFETLYTFCAEANCADGAVPFAELLAASDGDLYGSTQIGGANGEGTIFRIDLNGQLTTLYSFCSLADCSDGMTPYGRLVQGSDGKLYGTTLGGLGGAGTIFSFTPDGTLATLYTICLSGPPCADGSTSAGGLIQHTNGKFYGTTALGGNDTCDGGCGTIYSLDVGLGPFVALVNNPAKVGQSFGILGQGFTGATSVLLNGTPVSFKVALDTVIKGTVPADATTGYVTVTTPSGTLTSNVPFHVVQ